LTSSGSKILCTDFDHILEKREDIIHGRILTKVNAWKCSELFMIYQKQTMQGAISFVAEGTY
jgi:hypothetical protein